MVYFQRTVYRDIQLIGYHSGNRIHITVGQVHNTPHIPNDTFGSQCTKSDNLYHLIFPVFLSHIIDHFLPPFIAEININIGHGYPLRI